MAKNNKKVLVLNTLVLLLCIVIIALYSLIPLKGKDVKKFVLTFDSDGGSAVAAVNINDCEVVTQPTNPTKEGYIFVGWELNGEPFDFSKEVCGDVELKAVWEEMNPEKEYITIYLQYGEGDPSPVVVEKGTIPQMPQTPTRDGYNFVEWHVNGFYYGFDTPLDDGAIVEAVWEEIPDEPEPEDDTEYTVTFNLNGGTAGGNCDDQTVKKGGTAKNVCKPTRDGYTLNGWSPKITSKITKNTTFVAQWKANSSGGGSSGGDSGGGSGGDTPTPPPATTYNLSCSVAGSSTHTQSNLTSNSTSNAASICNNHKGDQYNEHLYTINFTAGNCSVSGTSISCNTTPTKKRFTVSCTEVPNANQAPTNTCSATSNAGSGSTIMLNGKAYPGKPIPDSMANSATWGICFGSVCADDDQVTYRYVGLG